MLLVSRREVIIEDLYRVQVYVLSINVRLAGALREDRAVNDFASRSSSLPIVACDQFKIAICFDMVSSPEFIWIVSEVTYESKLLHASCGFRPREMLPRALAFQLGASQQAARFDRLGSGSRYLQS